MKRTDRNRLSDKRQTVTLERTQKAAMRGERMSSRARANYRHAKRMESE